MKSRYMTCLVTALSLLVGLTTTCNAGEVGVFLSSLPKCKLITTAGSTNSCNKDIIISSGDTIVTDVDPKTLPIQWISSELISLDKQSKGQYRIVFTPPAETKLVIRYLGDLLPFVRKAGRVTNVAVTRSSSESQLMLPGDRATLLPGRPVTFSWCASGIKKIAITSESGAKFKEVAVPEGQRSITILPEDLGLKSQVVYRWKPLGASSEESGRITLLDKETARIITDTLLLIDREQTTTADKSLKKAAYLQFISENYAENYSLGWLQYSIVDELAPKLSSDESSVVNRLKFESGINYCW